MQASATIMQQSAVGTAQNMQAAGQAMVQNVAECQQQSGGGFLDSITNMFSGDGILGSIGGAVKGMFGGGESGTSMLSGVTKTFDSFLGKGSVLGDLTTNLGGLGGIVSLGTSIAEGDIAGSITTALQAGLTTFAGPLGTAIAPFIGSAVSALGIGAKWERQSEWMRASMKVHLIKVTENLKRE